MSWLITRFRNRVPGCWNRVTRIRLYSIFFLLYSRLLNWFLLLATNVVGLHFPHAECGSGYVWVFHYEINQSNVYQQIELCGYSVCQLIISRLARFSLSVVFQVLQHCGLKYSETYVKCCFIALFHIGLFAAWIIAKLTIINFYGRG